MAAQIELFYLFVESSDALLRLVGVPYLPGNENLSFYWDIYRL